MAQFQLGSNLDHDEDEDIPPPESNDRRQRKVTITDPPEVHEGERFIRSSKHMSMEHTDPPVTSEKRHRKHTIADMFKFSREKTDHKPITRSHSSAHDMKPSIRHVRSFKKNKSHISLGSYASVSHAGHKLVESFDKHPNNSKVSICESCNGVIKHFHHQKLICSNCPAMCHSDQKCLDKLTRQCPSENLAALQGWSTGKRSLSTGLDALLELEVVFLSAQLEQQDSKCHECHAPLKKDTKHRVCHFTDKFYCNNCHWDDHFWIPGSIFLLDDTKQYPVCRSAFLKLSVLWETALIQLPKDWTIPKAKEVFDLRVKIKHMRKFQHNCTGMAAIRKHIELTENTYIMCCPSLLRMIDVLDILDDKLGPRLKAYYKLFSEHIENCEICTKLKKNLPADNPLNS